MFFKRSNVPEVDAETLHKWINAEKDMILLDVRTEDEWKETGVIPGSIMVPNFKLVAEMDNGLNLDQGKPVISICRSGSRSKQVTEYLQKLDIDAINLKGGINSWFRNQFEIENV